MPDIVLVRIDDRLVHGQIITQWCKNVGANTIIVANDDTANNRLRQRIMDMAAPSYVKMYYWTLEKTISTIHKAPDSKKIVIVCADPSDMLKLVQGGVPIRKINIGNMPMKDGKRKITDFVAVDDKDVEQFTKMRELGIELEMKRVPSEDAQYIGKLFQ